MPGGDAASRRTASWRAVDVVLGVVAVVLVVALVTVLRLAPPADGADGRAAALSSRSEAVTAAARREALAFLTVDHRDMEPLVDRVLAGATGSFAAQYRRGVEHLLARARRTQAVSTGRVRSVGVGDLDADRAVVLVAADARVRNTSTKGQVQPRFYRLELTLVRHGDAWLTSRLAFVG